MLPQDPARAFNLVQQEARNTVTRTPEGLETPAYRVARQGEGSARVVVALAATRRHPLGLHGSSPTSSGPLVPSYTAVDRVCRFYFPFKHIVFSEPLASEKFARILGGDTRSRPLRYAPNASLPLHVLVDSSWKTKFPCSGAYFFFMGCPFHWLSKMQRSVTLSSAEAEFFGCML